MEIYGIDFTNRPKRRKAITCLACSLEGTHLTAKGLEAWHCFEDFETTLRRPGPWIAGIDFPFGLARRFIETIGWPAVWRDYVNHVSRMERSLFRAHLHRYREGRPAGDKENRRETDVRGGGRPISQHLIGSCSVSGRCSSF